MEETIDRTLSRLRVNGGLSRLAVSDTGFAFDPQSGHSFTLNETAMLALSLLKQGEGMDRLAERMSAEYEVSPEEAESCLEVFVRQLGRYLQ